MTLMRDRVQGFEASRDATFQVALWLVHAGEQRQIIARYGNELQGSKFMSTFYLRFNLTVLLRTISIRSLDAYIAS